MKFRILTAAGVVLAGSLASAAVAPVGTLDQLVADGSTGITIGDKTFYDFSVTGNVAASQISYTPASGGNIGLDFLYNWSSTNANNLDTLISYRVHVNTTSPQNEITGVNLNFNGTTTGTSSLATNSTVTETVSNLNGTQIGQLSVFDAGPSNSGVNRDSATLSVAPTRDLILQKDIEVHSVVDGGTATISTVENSFQQTAPSSVPVPPALWTALSTLGLILLFPLRRRLLARA